MEDYIPASEQRSVLPYGLCGVRTDQWNTDQSAINVEEIGTVLSLLWRIRVDND